MVKLSEDLTRRVSELARLELSDAEVSTFTTQIGEVLKYVEQLQSIDVSGVEPMSHPLIPESTPLREDRIVPPLRDAEGRPKILTHAPDVMDDGFKVPQILSG